MQPLLARAAALTVYQRFLLASLLVMFSCMSGVGWWIGRQIEAGVLHRTSNTTAMYVESFVAPALQDLADHEQLSPERSAMLTSMLQGTLLGKQIVAFVVWDVHGRVLYSTDQSQVNQVFPISKDLESSLQGTVTSEFNDLEAEVHTPHQTQAKMLLSTYTPVHQIGGNRVIAVAEFYQEADDLVDEITVAQQRSWLIVCMATMLMYLSLIWFVRRVSATIVSQKATLVDQVEQLTELLSQNAELHDRVRLATARNATLNEQFLRRISADLHDGPAQYLGLALLRIDYLFEHAEVCSQGKAVVETLEVVKHSLQGALQEVRTISSGLGLPELQVLTLPDVIVRVVRAHEQRTQTKVDLVLSDLPEQASLPIKITLYRFVQEALNNAYRHAGGVEQQVRVSCEQATVAVEVSDRGCGFVSKPDLLNGTEHLGLVGMRERVASMGGQFTLESIPGRGTRIGAVLPLQTLEDACA